MPYIEDDALNARFDTLPEGGLSVTISLAEYRFLTQQVTKLEREVSETNSAKYKAQSEGNESKKALEAAGEEIKAQIADRTRKARLLDYQHGLVYDPLVDAFVRVRRPAGAPVRTVGLDLSGMTGMQDVNPGEWMPGVAHEAAEKKVDNK